MSVETAPTYAAFVVIPEGIACEIHERWDAVEIE
jgi:hypothetical protein